MRTAVLCNGINSGQLCVRDSADFGTLTVEVCPPLLYSLYL